MLIKFQKVIILIPTVYLQKRLVFQKHICFFSNTELKEKVWQSIPKYNNLKTFLLCMPIKYKISLLKAQVSKVGLITL